VQIPSNTTVVGAGGMQERRPRASEQSRQRHLRNITFEDAYDCFPQWDPTDGSAGNWNSQYDLISVLGGSSSVPVGSTHVWIDHARSTTARTRTARSPRTSAASTSSTTATIDITNAAHLVTVSWNRFSNHDKVMLTRSSDSGSTANGDVGKLNVTVHHNLFDRLVQRMPACASARVHVYNNYYVVGDGFSYGHGGGHRVSDLRREQLLRGGGGGDSRRVHRLVQEAGVRAGTDGHRHLRGRNVVNGPAVKNHVNVLNEYNADNPTKQLAPTVDWWPTLYEPMHPTAAVPALVTAKAGPSR